jgi:hypothetical protein
MLEPSALSNAASGRTLPQAKVALVVFVGRTTLWWLRAFRRGYRHCFAVVQTDRGWVVHDPLSHRTEISLLDAVPAADLIAGYRRQGCTAVITELRSPPRRMAPLGLHTCVESVKRVLGLHDRWLITPRQLYRALTTEAKS